MDQLGDEIGTGERYEDFGDAAAELGQPPGNQDRHEVIYRFEA